MQSQSVSIPCVACHRLNLPGGVRCAYCGMHFPPALDFDMGLPAPPVAALAAASTPATPTSVTIQQGKRTGVLGSLALLLFKGKSLLSLLKLGKIALTLSTMAISIGVYSRLYTWRFAIGFVVCILIHELGHVVVNARHGLKQTAPMFIPFVGALIALKSFPDDPTVEAESGAGGPIAGALAALVCVLIGNATHHPFWYALAASGFAINLFNLIPVWQLDGAHIASVFSPKIWNGVMIVLLLIVIKAPVPFVWLLLATNFMARITVQPRQRYTLARPRARLRMAAVYTLLCVGLSYGFQITGDYYGRERQPEFAPRRVVRAHPTRSEGSGTAVICVSRPKMNAVEETRSQRMSRDLDALLGLAGVFCVGVLTILSPIALGWSAWLLTRSAEQPFRARKLAIAVSAPLTFALVVGAEKVLWVPGYELRATIGAYLAATVAGLIYAGYAANQGIRKGVFAPYVLRLANCLGWAGGAALLVAYALDGWLTAGIIIGAWLVFLMRHAWLPVSKAAEWAQDMGEHARAEQWLRRALSLTRDPIIQAQLWANLTRLYLLQERGEAAFQTQEARETLLTTQGSAHASTSSDTNNPASRITFNDLQHRASALMLLDRFEEALTCCEQMLQSPSGNSTPLRLLVVHMYLNRLALLRGWGDEALAQSEWCLRATAKQSTSVRARLHVRRATALLQQGQAQAALEECHLAMQGAGELQTQAFAANVQALAHLQLGDLLQAERDVQRALRLIPDNLCFHYSLAHIRLAQGRREEGKSLMKALAERYPQEHWGHAAQQALAAA